jgi:hypothetical protein
MSLTLRKEHGGLYYTKKLPGCVSKVRFKTGVELYQLMKGKKKWTIGNIEPRDSLPLLIYSPYSDRYWYRRLGKDHSVSSYRKYIRDGNLYIYWDELWKGKVSDERESEGRPYYDYNKIRELLLLKEYLKMSEDQSPYKQRAIDIELEQIYNKP